MNIAIFVDKQGTAIDRLAQMVKEHLGHFNIRVQSFHPKRYSQAELTAAKELIDWADLIDMHYWKSGRAILNHFAIDKPMIVCHFNPYNLTEENWSDTYSGIVVGNEEMHRQIPYSHLVPYGVDLNHFTWLPESEYLENKNILMVVNRIEGKKGVLPVALACKQLGVRLTLVGNISKPDYFEEVINTGVVDFYENVSEQELVGQYHRAMIHVCNSEDNFESGTLPILEAMACGVPVLTRTVGHVPDLYNGSNLELNQNQSEDVEALTKLLNELIANETYRVKLRERAWSTVKDRTDRKLAERMSKVYYKYAYPGHEPLISVVVPTKDRPANLIEVLAGIESQTYKAIEILVVDSSENDRSYKILKQFSQQSKKPIKYMRPMGLAQGYYNLAEARNEAVIAADGDIIVFNDDRLQMKPGCVEEFYKERRRGVWLWGKKDGFSKGFVENLSAVYRADLIKGGMFCERINRYGGMSQEVRIRFGAQGFEFLHIETAQASSIASASGMDKRRGDITAMKHRLWRMYG